MTVNSMDVFSLRDAVVGEYRDFATSFTTIFAEEMAEAMRTGNPNQTHLDPPPADPRVAHPDRTKVRA